MGSKDNPDGSRNLFFNDADHFLHHHLFNYNYGSGILPLPILDIIFNTRYKYGVSKTIKDE